MYISDEEKEIIFQTVTGDDVLDYYGYLQRAKRGYNPFRPDKKPGSFHKTKKGMWFDFAENERYSPVNMVAIEENLNCQSDYPRILERLAEIGNLHFDKAPKGRKYKKKNDVHMPNASDRAFLGLENTSCMILYDDYNWSEDKPADDKVMFRSDPRGEGYIWYRTVKYRWAEMAEEDQSLLDLLIRSKAIEKIWKVTRLIKNLSLPSYSVLAQINKGLKTPIKPAELISVYKKMRLKAFELYREYGGVRELQSLIEQEKSV